MGFNAFLTLLYASLALHIASSFSINRSSTLLSRQRNLVTSLRMSDGGGGSGETSKSTKKGLTTIVIDKTESQEKQDEEIEEQWRVVLHNDEVHTFNYVIQSLCKVIGTLDRKRAFDICVLTHGSGKATITKTWKDQAMKYCLGMQRQGLTASIAPESRFGGDEGGGDGGGEPNSGGGSE